MILRIKVEIIIIQNRSEQDRVKHDRTGQKKGQMMDKNNASSNDVKDNIHETKKAEETKQEQIEKMKKWIIN